MTGKKLLVLMKSHWSGIESWSGLSLYQDWFEPLLVSFNIKQWQHYTEYFYFMNHFNTLHEGY